MNRLPTSPRLRVARCGPEPGNRGILLCLLLLALAGCASDTARRLVGLFPAPQIPDNVSQADLEKLRDAPPRMSPEAHQLPPSETCSAKAEAASPCAKACRGTAPIPPGCYATCAVLGGAPVVTLEERTSYAPYYDAPYAAQQKAPPATPSRLAVPVPPARPQSGAPPAAAYPPGGTNGPPAARRFTLAEYLLWLRSSQAFAAVEAGGQW